MDQRRVASCADVVATWPKIAGSRTQAKEVHPTARSKKGKGKGKGKSGVNEVTIPTEWTPEEGTPPVKSRESPKMTLGTVLSPWMRMKTMNSKLDTSWQRSGTEKHSCPKIGRLYVFWWTTAQMSMCAREISSGSPLSQAEDPHLLLVSGHKLKHNGEAVPMELRDACQGE